MPIKPKRKSKIKPAHTIAATAGVRARDDGARNMLDAEALTLVKLRGEELGRLAERVFRLETNQAKRGPAHEQQLSGIATAIRARDVVTQSLSDVVHALSSRVDGLERRISATEAWLFDIAGRSVQNTPGAGPRPDAPAPVQQEPEPEPGPAAGEPSSCTSETNSIGTEGGP